MTAYTPRGFPKAAIEHITAHGPTFSGPLAEAINCESKNLTMMMEAAVRNGALVKERKLHMGTSCNLWSLGSGVPIEPPKDEPLQAEGVDIDSAHKAQAQAHPFTLVDHTAIDDPEPAYRPRVKPDGPMPGPAPAPAPTGNSCEFALTSTGRLLIDVDGEKIALNKAQADQLIAYLVHSRLTTSGGGKP
jgi:hypothetical protein